jgi:signal transduction histidine kinase
VIRRLLHGTSDSLTARTALASVALVVVVGAVAVGLLSAVFAARTAAHKEAEAQALTSATLEVQGLVVDLENSLRGLALSGDEHFVTPWKQARKELDTKLPAFVTLASKVPGERARALDVQDQVHSYITDYAAPLVRSARTEPEAVSTPVATTVGNDWVNAIKSLFAAMLTREQRSANEAAAHANMDSRRAIAVAIAGLVALAAIVALFGVYVARSVARPVRQVADEAQRLAAGEEVTQLRERGSGEVADLTRAFNSMARQLESRQHELEEQNRQLRDSEHAKSELVSIVSHELRTPLTSMLGFTSLLARGDQDEEAQARYLEIIASQGQRLATLLDDFLSVQQLEEGRLELRTEWLNLVPLLRQQAELYSAHSDGHEIVVELDGGTLPVRGDEGRLAQVIGNLLSNAIKYSPDGGRVTLSGLHDGARVLVRVRDEGIGIPDEEQEKLFTKFFRGDAAARGIAGSGLGLAFARAVVEAHEGTIGFTSTEGSGTTFEVDLPAAGAAQTPAQAKTERSSA